MSIRFYLSTDDFHLLENVVQILEPVSLIRKGFSSSDARVGDVLPLMTCAIDQVTMLDVSSSSALELQKLLISTLSDIIKMLLGVESELPCTIGLKLGSTTPTEFVIAAYLNPRFSTAIHECYGCNERVIFSERKRLFRKKSTETIT